MKKIRSIQFIDHPVLGNLSLDFCDRKGQPVDTVIFAGENGTGKSTILEILYAFTSRMADSKSKAQRVKADVVYEIDGRILPVRYRLNKVFDSFEPALKDDAGFDALVYSHSVRDKYPTEGIYSDVGINFVASSVTGITSMDLDAANSSRRSDAGLASQISQLIVDIQALDDADFAYIAKANPDSAVKDLLFDGRIMRFTRAFDRMFDNVKYDRVETINGCKQIVFKKYGKDISLDSLSSGEKQIVYRGCFLLKDANSLQNAFVFIDEPEISLHPVWQEHIMDYYKSIFTDQNGIQTSQIFIATHSPFIVHNYSRRNDKVIVLAKDKNGETIVKDNPEYYRCNSYEAVEDAFSTDIFRTAEPTVYVEGRTDEKYIRRALDVLDISPRFDVRWIGYIDENGQERNTGDRALTQGFEFCCSQPQSSKRAFLYDCDTKHGEHSTDMVAAFTWPTYENPCGMQRGIENSISFENIDLSGFYNKKETISAYREKRSIETLDKMKLCEHICGLGDEELKQRFSCLRPTLEKIANFFSE